MRTDREREEARARRAALRMAEERLGDVVNEPWYPAYRRRVLLRDMRDRGPGWKWAVMALRKRGRT